MASRRLVSLIMGLTMTASVAAEVLNIDFEDLTLPNSESSWSGNYPVDGVGGTGELTAFVSRGAAFSNFSDGDWWFWEGFAYSNMSDTTTPGYANQFSACTGTGYNPGDDIYAVGFVGFSTIPTLTFTDPAYVAGGYFTNTTYAALAMLNGEWPARKFGGSSGDEPDWFMLTITGKNAAGAVTGAVDFYLADYRFSDNGQDYIVDGWEYVDLTSLGPIKNLEFTLSSSDTGTWGMNTPAYYAMDELMVVPEPTGTALLVLGTVLLGRRKGER